MSSRARTGSNEAVTRGILVAAAAGILVVAYVPRVTARFVTDRVTCPVRLATGWKCPFCGMTHGTVSLLHGQFDAMVRQNAFALVFVVGLALLLLGSFGVERPRWLAPWLARWGNWSLAVLGWLFVSYAVLRNVSI